MSQTPPCTPLSGRECLSVLLVPWTFVVVWCALFVAVLLPRMQAGHALAVVGGVFSMFVFVTCGVAAVTFSHDVLTGHWP